MEKPEDAKRGDADLPKVRNWCRFIEGCNKQGLLAGSAGRACTGCRMAGGIEYGVEGI